MHSTGLGPRLRSTQYVKSLNKEYIDSDMAFHTHTCRVLAVMHLFKLLR